MDKLVVPGNIFLADSNEFKQELLKDFQNKKVVLFMSKSSLKRLELTQWYNKLESVCTSLFHISNFNSNPTYIDVYNSLNLIKDNLPNIVLAIGGGSSIDIAKATVGLSYLTKKSKLNEDIVLEAIKNKEFLQHENNISIYAVPTTAGTGSEVTRWATVWDMKGCAKYSVDSPSLYPHRAYIIPEFTVTMPLKLTLSTGLDALCQAVEAYWAKATNMMVKELSKSAIRLIVEYLPKVLKDPNNIQLRKKMFLGSLFSGLAFSNTRTTACHSISYPLTMRFGVDHGLACVITLSSVLEINKNYIEELDELYDALNIKDSNDLQSWLDNISKGIIDLKLSTFGIAKSDIKELASMSFTLGRMDNNPVLLNEKDVEEILRKLF